MSPFADNIMVHADPFHSYCVAIVAVAPQAVENWALKQGIKFTGIADLCQQEETLEAVHVSLVKVCTLFR